jgi:hypothetical protein
MVLSIFRGNFLLYIFLESWLILFSPRYVLYCLLLNKLLPISRGNIFLFFLILV